VLARFRNPIFSLPTPLLHFNTLAPPLDLIHLTPSRSQHVYLSILLLPFTSLKTYLLFDIPLSYTFLSRSSPPDSFSVSFARTHLPHPPFAVLFPIPFHSFGDIHPAYFSRHLSHPIAVSLRRLLPLLFITSLSSPSRPLNYPTPNLLLSLALLPTSFPQSFICSRSWHISLLRLLCPQPPLFYLYHPNSSSFQPHSNPSLYTPHTHRSISSLQTPYTHTGSISPASLPTSLPPLSTSHQFIHLHPLSRLTFPTPSFYRHLFVLPFYTLSPILFSLFPLFY